VNSLALSGGAATPSSVGALVTSSLNRSVHVERLDVDVLLCVSALKILVRCPASASPLLVSGAVKVTWKCSSLLADPQRDKSNRSAFSAGMLSRRRVARVSLNTVTLMKAPRMSASTAGRTVGGTRSHASATVASL
jgi:hypothetical protein